MTFIVHMEAVINRLAFHIGNKASYVDDGHLTPPSDLCIAPTL
jgi:hypothetical protein